MPQPPGPRKPAEKRKTKWLRIRITPELDADLKQLADKEQITVSSWVTRHLAGIVTDAKKNQEIPS